MKFFLKSEWTLEEGCYVTTKQYHCPNCHYVRKIREKNGETEVLEGDKSFILFPFTSLTKEDGSHAELVACPRCQTVQFVDRLDEEEEFDLLN